jgi:hypothetical protein
MLLKLNKRKRKRKLNNVEKSKLKQSDPKLIAELHKRYRYDAEVGEFYLRIDLPTVHKKIGDVATLMFVCGRRYDGSYIYYRGLGFKLDGVDVKVSGHRAAWLFHYGKWPAMDLDHINGNKLDNRINNLREVTQQKNSRNQLRSTRNTSGFPGVTLISKDNKYKAAIKHYGKYIQLGIFIDPKDAFRARVRKELEFWGALSVGTVNCIREHQDLTEEFKHLLESSTSASEEKGDSYAEAI